jgi:hypothetical protein
MDVDLGMCDRGVALPKVWGEIVRVQVLDGRLLGIHQCSELLPRAFDEFWEVTVSGQ